MHARTLAVCVPLLICALAAQKPTFEHGKRAATLEYGSVPLGTHTIAELPIGGSWRLGSGGATLLHLAMPAISGETVMPAGAYQVSLSRTAEGTCALVARGSGKALGGGEDLQLSGPLGKAAKPSKKLVIDWAKDDKRDEKPVAGTQPAKLVVTFGDNEWLAPVTFPGNKVANVTGGKLVVFALPAALMAARDKKPMPVAVFAKGEESWNLLVGKDEAKLVPWLVSTTSMRDAPKLDETMITKGTVEAVAGKAPSQPDTVEHLAASLSKGELVVELAFGQEAVRVRVPEPKAKGK